MIRYLSRRVSSRGGLDTALAFAGPFLTWIGFSLERAGSTGSSSDSSSDSSGSEDSSESTSAFGSRRYVCFSKNSKAKWWALLAIALVLTIERRHLRHQDQEEIGSLRSSCHLNSLACFIGLNLPPRLGFPLNFPLAMLWFWKNNRWSVLRCAP